MSVMYFNRRVLSQSYDRLLSHTRSTHNKLQFSSFHFQSNSPSKPALGFLIQFRNFSLTNINTLRMRFVQFKALKGGPQRLGVQLSCDGDIIDVSGVDHSIPNNLVQFLQSGTSTLEKAKR